MADKSFSIISLVVVPLIVKFASCKQQIVRSCFLIQSDNLYLWIRELSLFEFKVMIEEYVLIPVFIWLFFQIESHVDCSLLLALFHFGFCWFTELSVFPALVGSSIPCLSFITLWHLTFVNVFHPLPYDLFP
jgi:hypothetical protein